jgi:hypothetical protein
MGSGTRLELRGVALATDLAAVAAASLAVDFTIADSSALAEASAEAVAGAVVSVGDLAGEAGDLAGAGDTPGLSVGAGVRTGITLGGVLIATVRTRTAAITNMALRMRLRPIQIMGITIPTDRRTQHRNPTTTRGLNGAGSLPRPRLRPTV